MYPPFWHNQDNETCSVTYSFYGKQNEVVSNVASGTDISEIVPPDHTFIEETSEFIGWCLSGEDEPFTGPVTEDITLYPEWESGYLLEEDGEDKTYSVYSETGLKTWAETIATDDDVNCELLCDITLSDVDSETESNWNPVDYSRSVPYGYKGTFDGNGHWVRNLILYKKASHETFFGFFRRIDEGAIIKDFKLQGKINATEPDKPCILGSIVASNSNGQIINCTSLVDIEANVKYEPSSGAIGGIVGSLHGGKVVGCYHSGKIVVMNQGEAYSDIGGIVGDESHNISLISACYFNGQITASQSNCVGAIAGDAYSSTISSSFWKSDIEKADKWFDTKGQKTVFICRFIPIVRSLISIPAGMSEMKIWKFLLYTVLGSTIWNTVLVILGRALGESWETVVNIFDKFSNVILVLLVIIFFAFVIWWFGFRKNKKSSKTGKSQK